MLEPGAMPTAVVRAVTTFPHPSGTFWTFKDRDGGVLVYRVEGDAFT